jgi:putative cell wall-binding protein
MRSGTGVSLCNPTEKYYKEVRSLNLKRSLALVLTLIMVLSLAVPAAFAADVERLSGSDRFVTAVEISKAGWTTSDVVVLANGLNFPDALAGVPLAHQLGAPILLTGTDSLNKDTKAEIERLGAEEVYILGGLTVISQDVEDALEDLGLEVTRIAGDGRYETAALIAAEVAELAGGVDAAVVVYGLNYPDALAAASYAAMNGMPILLTATNSLPEATADAIEDLGIEDVIVVGGKSVVSDDVLDELDAERVAGDTREGTALALAEYFGVGDFVYIATGYGYADAITGAVLAAKNGTGILLVGKTLPADVADFLGDFEEAVILGGTSAVSAAVANAVEDALYEEEEVDFKVESVEVLNAKQIKVTFSENADKWNIGAGHFRLDNEKLTTADTFHWVGLDTVIITLSDANKLVNKTTYVFQVDAVRSYADYLVKSPVFVTTFTASDTTAPVVTGVEAFTRGSSAAGATIYFSEPIASGTLKIDGTSVAYTSGYLSDGTFYVDVIKSLTAADEHTLEVIHLTDYATRANVTVHASYKFNVTVDTVKPVVKSIEPVSDGFILVTFSKAMNMETVLEDGNITLKNEKLNDMTIVSASPYPYATTNNAVLLEVEGGLYDRFTSSRDLTLVFDKAITDWLGNAMVATTKSITLTQDKVRPVVNDITFARDDDGNVMEIIIHFSEDLAEKKDIDFSSLTIVDKDGRLLTPTNYELGYTYLDMVIFEWNGQDETYLTTTGTTNLINNKWTISVPYGLVTDLAQEANDSAGGFSKEVDMTLPASSPSFSFGTGTVTDMVWNANSTGTITVTYPEKVKGGGVAGSATDRNNYSINGSVLPEGTSITLDPGQTVAKITIPAGFIAKNDNVAAFRINNVQNLDGVTISPVLKPIKVFDNTKPVLLSARRINSGVLELTFSEPISFKAADGSDLNEINVGKVFEIIQGTTIFKLDDATDLVATKVPGYDKKIYLKLNATYESPVAAYFEEDATSLGEWTITGKYTGETDKTFVITPVSATKFTLKTNDGAAETKTWIGTGSDKYFVIDGIKITNTGLNPAEKPLVLNAYAPSTVEKYYTFSSTAKITIESLVSGGTTILADAQGNLQVAYTLVEVD